MRFIASFLVNTFGFCTFFFLLSLKVWSQNVTPNWECISYAGNDVQLNWQTVDNPNGDFIEYQVFSQENGLITSIPNIAQSNYLHTTINTVRNYYVVAVFGSGNVTGNTYQNVRLNLNNPGTGVAQLSWTNPVINLSNPNSNWIYIQREYPAGNWQTVDSTLRNGSAFHIDTIDICSAFLNYRLAFPGNGCTSYSSVVGDQFTDQTTPDIPVVLNVSIDTLSGEVVIDWLRTYQKDTYGYVIYKEDNSGFLVEIDTVWGWNNTSYNYVENTSIESLSYSIAAFDSCFTQTNPPSYQTSAKADVQTTAFVNGSFNKCLQQIRLQWSAYGGENVSNYSIFENDGVNGWILLNTTNSTLFTFSKTQVGDFHYVIRSNLANGSESFSNIITVSTDQSTISGVNYLLSASVSSEGIQIRHLGDPNSGAPEVAIDRRSGNGNFSEIGRMTRTGNITTFIDSTASIDRVNHYRAVLIDSCGNRAGFSQTVSTIYLEQQTNPEQTNTLLNWTHYQGFDGGTEEYRVFRVLDGQFNNAIELATVGSQDSVFVDDITNVSANYTLCYFVQAVEAPNSFGFAERANSQQVCPTLTPLLFIPNAFSPDGVNKEFKPISSFTEMPYYEMTIYNRWSHIVFQTKDLNEGWNGREGNDGSICKNDVYVYYIRFSDDEGREKVFKGALTLVR